ncbi:SET domain protein, putative [Plasmodium ovale wallikeri]|uniref:SET domain protein, putative n=2 Tax=Plasmodium ovale TaxID=36330 RepID=A0A1A8YVM5_PLAOA|nr:SET domain protein, putative [Plasmodium ovale wallikeri]SBT35499.1 SET domain protein, putative [Plasmodium ovale wallikeri]SBT77032.1 SET domain protein, putative [Plasmodium ovale]
METILRKLRRSSKKKKNIAEIDALDEKNWAQAKTLDFEDDSFNYSSSTKCKNNVKKNEKREDSIEEFYVVKDELKNAYNKKKEEYYINSISRMNEDITNVSTDFTNDHYIKKKRNEHSRYIIDNEKVKLPYVQQQGFDKYACETKEFSEVEDELDLYQEADIDGEKMDVEDEVEEEEVEEDEVEEDEVEMGEIEDDEVEVGAEMDEEDAEVEYEYVYEQAEDVDEAEAEVEEAGEEVEEVDLEIADREYSYEEQMGDKDDLVNSENKSDIQGQIKIESSFDNKEMNVVESEENEEYLEEKLEIYNIEEIDNEVEIAHVKGKGRCMFTRKSLDPGSIIFIEKPLLIITPSVNEKLWDYLNKLNNEQNFELPLKWHYAALCTITQLNEVDFKACVDKWIPEPNKEADEDVFNVLDKVCEKKITKNGKKYYYYKNKLIDPNIYDRIIQVWHYNAFGHHTDSEGLVLYNRISMLAHSCNSTACWHYGENDSFVLRARVKLNVGDELTISYLGDDDLYKSSNIRREKLTNWLFVCMCNRCTNPVDNSRGFKCATCGIGTFFIKSEYHDEIPIITKCNICQSEISENTAYEYIEYENSYIERLQETDKNDLSDALAVYIQADKIFTQHWIMFQLYTILFEGYRDSRQWEKAIYYQMQRIKYAVDVIPRANYVLAWLYEELGEVHANSINTDILLTENDFTITYEEKKRICSHFLKSIHLLEILCGYSHDYLKDSLNKYYRIDSLTTTDAPQIEE